MSKLLATAAAAAANRGAMSIQDLPEIEEGDYGWCIYDGGSSPCLVYYDDDECWCSNGYDETEDEHECDETGERCYLDSGAIVYHGDPLASGWEVVPHQALLSFPARIPDSRAFTGGLVYAISIVPDLDMRRIKVGYTTNLASRLASYRTLSPNALVIGAWAASPDAEDAAHHALDGRIGTSEVFQVCDVLGALGRIEAAIRSCRP